ncbi:FA71D protein, partial [Nyctibius bracteatus]|nr:FA71D protein [Nyctibius bracteatus]
VTIGICAANPSSPMPNVMLVAREVPVSPLSEQPPHVEQLELARLFPLEFVQLSVHNTDKHLLVLRLANCRCYYLELCAPPDQEQHLFLLWVQLISLLKPPENTSNTKVDVKSKDFDMCHTKAPSPDNPPENKDNPQDVPNPKREEEVAKQTSPNQVPLSGTVGPTEESGSKEEASHSFLKPTMQENTMQSKNIDPLDTKTSKSTEKKKT